MKAVLMALVMTIRASSGIEASRCFPLSISRFDRHGGSTAPCAGIVVVSAKTDRCRFCYAPLQQSRLFRCDRKRRRLRQQHCLDVAPRPAMSVWSMGRVGLIDTTVGNAARLGSSLGASQRSTTRRCASHHIATQRASRRDIPAARARSTLRCYECSAAGTNGRP
jgi:hypothetical protein